METVYICSKKVKFFCTITVGINCRDGSNTLVFIRTGRYVTGPYTASEMYCTTSAPPVRIRHDIMVMMMRQQKRQYYRWVWVPPLICSALIRKLTWLVRWFRCGGWHYDICYCNCKSCCPTSLHSLTSRRPLYLNLRVGRVLGPQVEECLNFQSWLQ